MKILVTAFILTICFVAQAQSIDYYNDLAKQENEKKNYSKLLEYANQSLGVQANGLGYWWRAIARYYLGYYETAAQDYLAATSYYSSDNSSLSQLWFWRGLSFDKLQKYSEAFSNFEEAEKKYYSDTKTLYWYMGNEKYSLAKYADAITYYTKAIDKASTSSDLATLYEFRAYCYKSLYEYEKAISDYTKAVQYNSGSHYVYWYKCYCTGFLGRYSAAIPDCDKAIEILKQKGNSSDNNMLSDIYSDKGYFLNSLKKSEEAKQALLTSLQYNPNNYNAHLRLGSVYDNLKDWQNARKAYTNAISLGTNGYQKGTSLTRRAQTARKASEFGLALIDYTQAISIDTVFRNDYRERGNLFSNKKDFKAALKDLTKAIDISSRGYYSYDTATLVSIYIERAGVKAAMADVTGMVADFNKALQLDPGNTHTLYSFAFYQKTVLKNIELAKMNSQLVINEELRSDTSSDYSYAQAISGNLKEAVANQQRLIEKYKARDDQYRVKWELHNMACIYAISGNSAKALEYVEKSFVAGYDDNEHLLFDQYLVSLMKLPQWKTILAKYKVPVPKW